MLTSKLCSNFLKGSACLLVISLPSCDFISRRILTKPAVQVGSLKMSTQDLSRELANRLKDFDALSAKDPKILSVNKEQIINDFIITSLINLWFDEQNIKINPLDLKTEVKKISSSYPSDSSFKEALSEAGIEYIDWVKKTEAGLKKKQLLEQIRNSLAPPKEPELLSYFNNNKAVFEKKEAVLLSHILVADENQSEIVLKLLRKKSFKEVAREYSSAYTKEVEDSFGWIEKAYLVDLDRAFKMRTGDFFGPVQMQDGLHLFKIVDKRPYKTTTFADVRLRVLADVINLRTQAKFSSWLDEQFKKYVIKKNKAVLDSIKVETH